MSNRVTAPPAMIRVSELRKECKVFARREGVSVAMLSLALFVWNRGVRAYKSTGS